MLPDGSLWSLLPGSGTVPGIVPVAAAFLPVDAEGELVRYTFIGVEPPGVYTWFAALVQSGTGNVLGAIDQAALTLAP